jgi:hypothetical protein
MTAQARLRRLSTEAKHIDMEKAVAMRLDEVLTKRLTATTQAVGDTVLPILNQVLGTFLVLSDAIGKIPGLGKMIGWGAVLAGAVKILGFIYAGTLSFDIFMGRGIYPRLWVAPELQVVDIALELVLTTTPVVENIQARLEAKLDPYKIGEDLEYADLASTSTLIMQMVGRSLE